MKKTILASLLCVFGSLAQADQKAEVERMFAMPSTIVCTYTGLDYQNTNVLYRLIFERTNAASTYNAQLNYMPDFEFSDSIQVLQRWTAVLASNGSDKYSLTPTESKYNELNLEITKKSVRVMLDPPTEGVTLIKNIGKFPKYKFEFECEGGPLTNHP